MINRDNVTVELVNDLVDIKKLILMNISTAFRQDGTKEPQSLWDFLISFILVPYVTVQHMAGLTSFFSRTTDHRRCPMSYPVLNLYLLTKRDCSFLKVKVLL
jgi:hypothetical protein